VVSFLGALKDMQRRFWKWSTFLSVGALYGEPGKGGGFFSGDFERDVKRALEMEHLSLHRGSVRGTWKGGGVLFWGL
jgi:hypothetical protein